MEEKPESKGRRIKLYCPSASKIAQIMAWEDQKLDMGTISRMFGIEPATLKLNGHFISRGVDLIASSVTWKSLLSFFSSRGMSTGTHASGALIVDGKLSKCGTKRSHDPAEIECRVSFSDEGTGVGKDSQHEDINSPNYKKLKDNNVCGKASQTVTCSDSGLKRKHWLENVSPFKRSRVSGSFSNEISKGDEGGGNRSSIMSKLPCGFLQRETIKRVREDEVLITTSSKRTR